ncbi:MAG: class I SAM-dependent methyltransferase [Planctomycetota bacterium]|nr:class I SAM-dependent methyltransferase [Planctomycetota bacterium]
MRSPSSSDPKAPACLLCGRPTRLLYPSNVPAGEAIRRGEVACTSPYLSVHDDIYTCSRCGLARSVPPIDGEDIEDLYREVEDPAYLVSEGERRESFRDALGEIGRHGRPGRLLEIGSAVGLFLDEARKGGWDVTGIEPSEWASREARSRGLDVFTGTLEQYRMEGEPFDAVAMWDVLEHLVDPVADLRRIAGLLRPGGIVGLSTVNMAGLGAKVFRGRWPWFMRMHLHYFTPRSLSAMVRREGFEVLRVTIPPKIIKVGYMLDRARNLFGPLASASRWFVDRLGLEGLPIKVNLGDILLLTARRNS